MEIIIQELELEDDYISYCLLLKQLSIIDLNLISSHDFVTHLKKIKSNPLHKILIAKYNDRIVGSLTLLIEPKIIHNISYVAHIEDVVVDSSVRSKGIGSKLLDKAREISKQAMCYKIILDCAEKNVNFYEKNGFKRKELQMAMYLN